MAIFPMKSHGKVPEFSSIRNVQKLHHGTVAMERLETSSSVSSLLDRSVEELSYQAGSESQNPRFSHSPRKHVLGRDVHILCKYITMYTL